MNYFNYFTEIEEHFQRARQSGLFLLSPLDWAMIETWKECGVPLTAVKKGIDRTFEKWRSRKHKSRAINSLAYCAQEVLTAAREVEEGNEGGPQRSSQPAFPKEELAESFRRNARVIREATARAAGAAAEVYRACAASLEQLGVAAEAGELTDFEALEQRLSILEERLIAAAMQGFAEEELLDARRQMERQLAPYRRKMSAEQLALVEKQFLQRKRLEDAGLPRLSLFYL